MKIEDFFKKFLFRETFSGSFGFLIISVGTGSVHSKLKNDKYIPFAVLESTHHYFPHIPFPSSQSLTKVSHIS
jgi:hypothetical protein